MTTPTFPIFDVFLSAPMAGFRTADKYRSFRAEMMTLLAALEECGLSVFFAGRDVESPDQFDDPAYSVVRDIETLKNSRYLLMVYPERVVSSVLVEAGYALAMGMKAVYFVRDTKHLPFLLRHLDRVHPVKIYEYETIDRIVSLVRRHKTSLFEPWRETAPYTPTVSEPLNRFAPNEPQSGDSVGPYNLVRQLGEGAFGAVWLGERRTSLATTQFALKFPHASGPSVADAIRREAMVWVQASGHPNVLPVIEADSYDGRLVIVSPYVAEGSLAEWLKGHSGRVPSLADATRIASGILAGLVHLHSRRLVHRDLKPANVLLEGGIPRIADFGLARALAETLSAEQSHSHSVGGTPAYMAPEAWTGARAETTDIWSVGVILYELLAGRRPFPGGSAADILLAINRGSFVPLPSEVPTGVRNVVQQALHTQPDERYPTAKAMQDALASV